MSEPQVYNGHIRETHNTRECDDPYCHYCIGGLFVCGVCGRAEVELSEPCIPRGKYIDAKLTQAPGATPGKGYFQSVLEALDKNTLALSPRPKLFLIDASCHIYRAFHVKLDHGSPDKDAMQIPLVFGRIIRKLQQDYNPAKMIVCWDSEGATFRELLYPKYKAHRDPAPQELLDQLPYVKKLCASMGWPVVEAAGFEADDVIGTLAVQAEAAGYDVVIVANDKDMMQLVGPHIKMLRMTHGGPLLVDEAGVEKISGVPPKLIIDWLALMGDATDGVPGGKGIGEVGAVNLLKKYKTLDQALNLADYVANKTYRKALRFDRENILLSRTLVTIRKDVPLP